jgi:NADPH:quinone reductase-like Zn-dependent oxidoreductase
MKAVRIHKPEGFEGIDGLVYEDAPDPQPAIGDALVQVRAASFTPTELTWPLRTDRAGHDRGPLTPAHEGSGVVVELAYGTAGLSVGDEVYGLIDGYRDGWAAEYVAIEARSLAPKPATVDFTLAAAIPRPDSRHGRRCSTMASSSPARAWSSTAPAAGSGRWAYSWPAGPAPMS